MDGEKAEEFEKFFNHYLYRRGEAMQITQFKVEDELVDVLGEGSFSPERIAQISNLLVKFCNYFFWF